MLVQPLLIVALELVVQDHAIDARAAVAEALSLTEVRTKDLAVVFDLAGLLQLRVERLMAVLPMVVAVFVTVVVRVVSAMRFEYAPAFLGEHHGDVAMTVHPFGTDESFLAEMAQIA